MIESELAKAGLNTKEARIYLAALELGPTTILEINKKTGIKRPTIYEAIPSLIKAGLFTQTSEGRRVRFIAESPDKLLTIKKQELDAFQQILPVIEAFRNKSIDKPDIKWFQGEEAIREIMRDMIQNTNIHEQLLAVEGKFSTVHQRVGTDFLRKLLKEKKSRGLESFTISTMQAKEINEAVRKDSWSVDHPIEIRILEDRKNVFRLNFYLYQDKLTIISAEQAVALVVQNKILKDSFAFLFKVLWQNAEETKYRIVSPSLS